MRTLVDPFSAEQLTLAEAARRLPRLNRGRPVSPATLWRWYRRGIKARDGRLVRLQVWRCGGRTVTSAISLQVFFAALDGTATPPRTETPTATQDVPVEAQLDALGVR
jgi:hypothetical protein